MQIPDDIYNLKSTHTVDEYKQAVGACPHLRSPDSKYLHMLVCHYAAPHRTITSSDMADAMGWAHSTAANLHYGLLATAIARQLGHTPGKLPGIGVDHTANIAILVAFSGGKRAGKDVQWTLLPEVAQALEELGLVGASTGAAIGTAPKEPRMLIVVGERLGTALDWLGTQPDLRVYSCSETN